MTSRAQFLVQPALHALRPVRRVLSCPVVSCRVVLCLVLRRFDLDQMRMPFESEEARAINREIFETMYFAAMTASCELAEKEGAYETFEGSPVSKGIFQFDMWGEVCGHPSPRRRVW